MPAVRTTMAGLVALLVFHGAAWGAPVDAKGAKGAVDGWLHGGRNRLHESLGSLTAEISTVSDASGVALYHVVHLKPEGFVVVAADDRIEPIICFSAQGHFEVSAENPMYAVIRHDLSQRMANVRRPLALVAHAAQIRHQNKWAQFQGVTLPIGVMPLGIANASDVRVAPLVQSVWSQGATVWNAACYNYYTPPYAAGTSSNFPCGCVATAMAQLMRYWQYPTAGVGTAAYPVSILTSTGYDDNVSWNLRGGDGLGGPYAWSNMVLNPNIDCTLAQCQAIGALCADAGVAAAMTYRPGGSGAAGADAKNGLVNIFGYGNAVHCYTGDNMTSLTALQLCAMINPNLDAGYPVLLGLSPLGHEVVCDGYGYDLATLYYHLNYGLGGNSTAWYTLPDEGGSSGVSSIPECIYNVWPHGSGEIISGRITRSGDGHPMVGAVVRATCSAGGSYAVTSGVNGVYALAKVPPNCTYTVSVSVAGYACATQVVATGRSADNAVTAGNCWGLDFSPAESVFAGPISFQAIPVNSYSLNVSWVPNLSADTVLVAWSTNAIFGTPSAAYAPGDRLPGGGTVLYVGSATNAWLGALTGVTPYYLQAWSVRSGTSYSPAVACAATTLAQTARPFSQGFENIDPMYLDLTWSLECVTGSTWWNLAGWPHSGSESVCLNSTSAVTRLVTPAIDFGANPQNVLLSFWNVMPGSGTNQDTLRVLLKTNVSGPYALVAAYTNAVASWTNRAVILPNPGGIFYVAFEAHAQGGGGVYIDDVIVTLTNLAPIGFAAVAANSSCINLSWMQNISNDNVVVAWNGCPSFGAPAAACSAGDCIPGGGTVLYNGSATNISHAGLASAASYYYQAWSVRNSTNYSSGVACFATTSNRMVLPFTEGFEHAGSMPAGWQQVYVSGGAAWSAYNSGSHAGTYNANLYSSSATTRLITPPFDLGTAARNVQLSFWNKLPPYAGKQDTLSVYYRTNASGALNLLATYTNSITVWTNRVFSLPDACSGYSIVFEGNAKGGYGVFLDDVTLTASYPATNSFSVWTQLHCPGANITNVFQNCNDAGVPNGLAFAFGTNWVSGAPLINVRMVSGVPVVEVPQADAGAGSFVSTCVETTGDLQSPAWTSSLHAVDGAGRPANCNWLQPDAAGSNHFFRVRATLLE